MKTWQFMTGIVCLAIATVLFMVMAGERSLYGGIILTVVGIVLITNGRRIEMVKKEQAQK